MTEVFHLDSIPTGALSCCGALLVLIINNFLALPERFNPLLIIALLAKGIEKKVRPNSTSHRKQQLISGSLSYIVVFIPLLVILHIALSFVEYRLFFEIFILFIAASFQPQKRQFLKVQQALSSGKKLLARQWLSSIVKRDTNVLTSVGIGKAAIESFILRYIYQLLTPVLVYLAFGIVVALAYRIALECYWQWKQPKNQQDAFAQPVELICRIFQFIPMLMTLMLSFLFIVKRATINRDKVLTSAPKLLPVALTPMIFHSIGKRLGFTLGGPIQYSGERKKLPRYGFPAQIKMSDMQVVIYTINTLTLVISGVLLVSVTVLIVA